MLIVIVSFYSCSRSPNQIFRAIFEEIPDSVIILHGQDQLPLDCCLWLHFTISDIDYKKITRDYIKKELNYKKWTRVLPPEVDWWNPNKFESKGIYLEKTSQNERMIEGIYTNDKNKEIFYVNWYN